MEMTAPRSIKNVLNT